MAAGELVVGASYGLEAASTRVRVLEWLRLLDLDAEVLDYLGAANARPGTLLRRPLAVLAAERRLSALRRRPDWGRLLISRSLGPFTRGRLEADLLRRADWGVYDFDDALYADRRGGVHRFFGEGAGWSTAVGGADLVIAGNEVLAEEALRHNPHVEVIPSCVHPGDYPDKSDYTVGAAPRLLWLGSPSTEPYLAEVAAGLLAVHRRTGARLTVISAGERSLGELDVMVDRVAWDGTRSNAMLAEADCGIMPLPDTPFSRGKCAYKLLQYGAAGLPAVATPIGVNARVLDQLGGLAATGPDEWADALVALLEESEQQRRDRGLQARRAVAEHYSYAAWEPAFRRALRLPELPAPAAGGAVHPASGTGSLDPA
ncbi:glycosyltransferase [Blastococcus sp. URHD0036]|uniref:glycosyltransferase n=1 Tax=Blastococcus sp. URHD0036 TaxID=1380356 RepID=UPI000495E6C5|nr:glycosyltransferase [Blastococcus sp. URHD0036]